MAVRAGFPVPKVVRAQSDEDGRYVVLMPRSSDGVLMYVTPEGAALPGEVLDLVFLQEYVMAQLGLRQHRAVLPVIVGVPIVAMGIVLNFLVGAMVAIVVTVVAIPVVWSGYEAVWNRRFMRRVDRRLAELMGAEGFRTALGQLAGSREWERGFGWLYLGAPPLPPERLRWVQNAG
ncbi:hypothetical protein [Kribbella voronezhensis]|nr:hypothetical protein [Kribbella voronezhensis]